jgi:ubiquitin fusion degradation protein 1
MLALHLLPSHVSLIQPPDTFLGAGNSLDGRPASSSAQSTGKGKSKASDTGNEKVDEERWGTGQGRSLGTRPPNGVDRRTHGAGLTGVGGASVPRLSQRGASIPRLSQRGASVPRLSQRSANVPRLSRRSNERSPTPDFGVDDEDVIVIDSDVD